MSTMPLPPGHPAMGGLLGGGQPMGGLLSPQMQMASALLQASGPSRMPVSMGQALGQGIDAYGRAQAQQHAQQMQQRLLDARLGGYELERQKMEREAMIQQKRAEILADPNLGALQKAEALMALGDSSGLELYKATKPETSERKIIKDANGRQRYADTGDFVFPDVSTASSGPSIDTVKVEQQFRKEFDDNNAEKREVVNKARQLQATLATGGGMADVAAVFQFLKSLDPRSVVRGSEVDMLNSAQSLTGRLQALVKKAESGEGLTPVIRSQMLAVTDSLAKLADESYAAEAAKFQELSKRSSLNPANVVLTPDLGYIPAPPFGAKLD